MYSETNNHATFFCDKYNKNTDKVFYGVISVPVKTGKKDDKGKDIYEYENWNARFVGAAKDKAGSLKDKDRITLLKWSTRSNFVKEKSAFYPYVMVMDFEVREPAKD